MLGTKGKQPSVKIKHPASDSEISSIMSPHAGKFAYDKAHRIRETLNCSMLSMLVLLFLLSVAAYALILGLRYLVATTDLYGEQDNCILSRMFFNGWSFKYKCISCAEGFVHQESGIGCVAHSQH